MAKRKSPIKKETPETAEEPKPDQSGKKYHRKKGSSSGTRTMWKGSISFGLVNIPVRLYNAVQEKKIHFHMFSEKEECRVRQKLVCEGTAKNVERNEIVKGYETSPGKFVVVKPEELEKLEPKATHTIDILQFTDLDQIDPIYFSKSYYLLPEPTARKAYAVFTKALEASKKVAIAKFIMYEREYLVTLRIMEHCICLELMHFYDEIRDVHNLPESDISADVSKRELDTARQLIDSLSGDFKAEKFHDEYREKVLDLIKKKQQGKKVIFTQEAEEEGAEVVDLMSALEASLKKAKAQKKAA